MIRAMLFVVVFSPKKVECETVGSYCIKNSSIAFFNVTVQIGEKEAATEGLAARVDTVIFNASSFCW